MDNPLFHSWGTEAKKQVKKCPCPPESTQLLILGAAFLSRFTFAFRTPELWLHFNCFCTADCCVLSPRLFPTSTFWEEFINVIWLQYAGSVWHRWPNPVVRHELLVPHGHYWMGPQLLWATCARASPLSQSFQITKFQ